MRAHFTFCLFIPVSHRAAQRVYRCSQLTIFPRFANSKSFSYLLERRCITPFLLEMSRAFYHELQTLQETVSA
jgi:hypothetical protein